MYVCLSDELHPTLYFQTRFVCLYVCLLDELHPLSFQTRFVCLYVCGCVFAGVCRTSRIQVIFSDEVCLFVCVFVGRAVPKLSLQTRFVCLYVC